METPKRKYQKHKTEKVISISHYLNKRLKGKTINGEVYYPLYIQINYNGQTTNVKSRLDKYISEAEFDKFELDFKSEIKEEAKTIKDSIKRHSENEEKAKAKYFVQGLQPLKKSIDQSLIFEMQFIIARKDEDALNWYQKSNRDKSNLYNYMYWLSGFSRRVTLINWNEFEPLYTLELLVNLMPDDLDLKHLHDSLNQELSFEDIYEEVATKHFNSQPKLEDWRTERFQQLVREEYNTSPYLSVCNQYILIISDLFIKQNRI